MVRRHASEAAPAVARASDWGSDGYPQTHVATVLDAGFAVRFRIPRDDRVLRLAFLRVRE